MEDEKEVWKQIEDYPLYEISNLGRVKSCNRFKNRILKAGTNSDGYLCVNLWNATTHKNFKVHKLVLVAFGPPQPTIKHQTNHKDGNKQNNHISNLEWVTNRENRLHAYDVLNEPYSEGFGRGETHVNAKLSDAQILRIRNISHMYRKRDLAFMFKVSTTYICDIIARRNRRD